MVQLVIDEVGLADAVGRTPRETTPNGWRTRLDLDVVRARPAHGYEIRVVAIGAWYYSAPARVSGVRGLEAAEPQQSFLGLGRVPGRGGLLHETHSLVAVVEGEYACVEGALRQNGLAV